MKIRSFLAFDIPDEVRKNLAKVIADFREKERAVKWANPENMHVTLKFFGSVEEDLLLGEISNRIESVVRGHGPPVLRCEGIGVFPNWKYPRVFWAGFSGETEKTVNLQKAIESTLSPLKLREDRREFRLHLTIGRAKGALKKSPLIDLVEKLGPVGFGEVRVDKLVLYKSVLTKAGPVYTPLKEFSL